MNEITVTDIGHIEDLCKGFAQARESLGGLLQAFESEFAALRRRHSKPIKAAAGEAALRRADLERELQAHPELFEKPRTITCHGIRVGYQKGKGKIECPNEAAVIERIEKLLPDQADVLVRVEKRIAREALKALDVSTLKRLGLVVTATGDAVLIKPVSDQVEKLVDRLLKLEASDMPQ